jgi:hypothetical protein
VDKLGGLIRRDGIEVQAIEVPPRNGRRFLVALLKDDRKGANRLSVLGPYEAPEPPDAFEVLSYLFLVVTASVERTDSYETWVSDVSAPTDRKPWEKYPKRLYTQWVATADRLRDFLGDRYDEYRNSDLDKS